MQVFADHPGYRQLKIVKPRRGANIPRRLKDAHGPSAVAAALERQ
jgi:hypothetical protein